MYHNRHWKEGTGTNNALIMIWNTIRDSFRKEGKESGDSDTFVMETTAT